MRDQKLLLIDIMKGIIEHYETMVGDAQSEEDTISLRHYSKKIRKAQEMLGNLKSYAGV